MGHRLGEIRIFEPLNPLRGQSCQVANRNKDFPGLDLHGYNELFRFAAICGQVGKSKSILFPFAA